MYLLRFVDYLDEWKSTNRFKKLPSFTLHDCAEKNGDLSLFLISSLDGGYRSKEILNVVCRYVFSNFTNWSDSNKQNGAIFLPREEVERIKKFEPDPPGVLNTIHCNLFKVLAKETFKIQKLIYKHRNVSHYYDLHCIENVVLNLTKEQWNELFSLTKSKNINNLACKLKREFFRGKNHKPPQELLDRIQQN